MLGFTIAYLISRRTRGRGLVTTLFLVPMMLSPVVVGLFWKFMLDAQFGVVNSFLGTLGLGHGGVADATSGLALLSVIIVDTWQWTPFIMLIALAGLTAVPKYLYEAASIDRASEWFRFRHITLPLVWPLLLIAVLFRAIEAFRLFDLVYILTNGGPGVVDRDAVVPRLQGGVPRVRHRPRVGLRDPDGDRRDPPRAALPALPRPAAGARDGAPRRRRRRRRGARTTPPPPGPRRRRRAAAVRRWFEIVVARGLFAVVMLFPVVWMLETSLKENRDVYAVPAKFIGFDVTFDHYKDVFVQRGGSGASDLAVNFKNSVLVAGALDDPRDAARRPRRMGVLALPDEGEEGPALLHPLDALHAAGRRRDPDLPDVPRPGPDRHEARADPDLRGVQPAVHDLDDEGLRRRGPGGVRGRRDARRLLADRGLLSASRCRCSCPASRPRRCSR